MNELIPTFPHPLSTNILALFNHEEFKQAIQQTKQPIKLFRETIKTASQTLDQLFKEQYHIRELIYGRAYLIDQILFYAWQQFSWNATKGISLIAVGGYGRGELHPFSDIDILILTERENAKNKTSIEKFLTFLWDINLSVGHSVRTIKQCQKEAAKDISVTTSLMESRTIAGDEILREKMLTVTGPKKIWKSRDFFKAKWEEQISRHNKYNNTEYNLEPNIKGTPGGLRDIQTIGWIAKRHFGVSDLHGLVERGFLTESEFKILNKCQDFLWTIRYGLHLLAGRADDRLLFDYQPKLAELLSYHDNEKQLGVEKFMQNYYRAVIALAELNELLIQHFDEAILRNKEKTKLININKRFQIHNNFIEVTHPGIFNQYPSALLEIFVLLAQNPSIQGVRTNTIRLIRDHRHLINNSYRNDIRNTALFIELLRSPHALFTQLRRMKRYGILGRYLPEFGKVIGKMQFDLFHIYTVDAHTLLVIKNMRRFRYKDSQENFPLVAQVFQHLPKVELAYISGLYHDIGKGRGGDHSTLGSVDAIKFCKRHRLGEWDSHLVAWLVQNHLLMSMTAQRQDISDPEVIQTFAKKIGNQAYLDYLYVLTVADICATNPTLWNSWRASLLKQLYLATKNALRRGLENPIDRQSHIEAIQKAALLKLSVQFPAEKIRLLWGNFGDEYFLHHTIEDIIFQTGAILTNHDELPLIMIRPAGKEGQSAASQIFIYIKDQDNLFAASVAILDQLHLNILDASIITSKDNFSLDTYIVLSEDGSSISQHPQNVAKISQKIKDGLENPSCYKEAVQRYIPRRLKNFMIPTEVTIFNDTATQKTQLEIITRDRPGLLAHLGRIFLDFDIYIHKAKIATLGERVEDVFTISDRKMQAITDPTICQRLRESICSELDQDINGNKEAKHDEYTIID